MCRAKLTQDDLDQIAYFSCEGSRYGAKFMYSNKLSARLSQIALNTITQIQLMYNDKNAKCPTQYYKIETIDRMKRCLYKINFGHIIQEASMFNAHPVIIVYPNSPPSCSAIPAVVL